MHKSASFCIGISGIGVAYPHPGHIVSNEDIHSLLYGPSWADQMKTLGQDPEYIRLNQGYNNRYWSNQKLLGRELPHVSSEDLMLQASRQSLKDAGIFPEDIEMMIVISTTAQRVSPAASRFISRGLGLNCPGFDMKNGCSSIIYALQIAANFISSSGYKNVLICCAETFSNWIAPKEHRSYGVGDAGGALILSRTSDSSQGIHYSYLDAESHHLEKTGIAGTLPPTVSQIENRRYFLDMPSEMSSLAAKKWELMAEHFRNNSEPGQSRINYIIPNQVNNPTINNIADNFDVPPENIMNRVAEVANCGCVGPVIGLYEARAAGWLISGKGVLVCAVGGGLSWGSILLKI